MANMEVLSWYQLSEHVRKIDGITQQILDLRSKYENVIEPIRDLTSNVDKLSGDVNKLSNTIMTVSQQVSRLENLTGENARQISEISRNVLMLTNDVSGVRKEEEKLAGEYAVHEQKLSNLGTKFETFSVLVYIFWALLLLVLGGLITKYIF